MANYEEQYRTNYFLCRDVEALESLVSEWENGEVWKHQDVSGRVAFGGRGFFPRESLERIQSLLGDNETLLITITGADSIRYLVALGCIITGDKIEWIDLNKVMMEQARLLNPLVQTFKNEY